MLVILRLTEPVSLIFRKKGKNMFFFWLEKKLNIYYLLNVMQIYNFNTLIVNLH